MGDDRGHLVIRGAEPDDADALCALLLCPNVQRQTATLPHISRADAYERMAAPREGRHTLVAVLDGRLVGQCALNVRSGRLAHVSEVGLTVHDDYVGQGVGSALLNAAVDLAERWLGLTRLELEVFTDNAAAIHLYEKHGFVIEGTKRRYVLRDGVYVDAHVMARVSKGATEVHEP